MKTIFKVIADTRKMTVTTEVRQGNKLMWTKQYPSISDALADMLNGIASAQAKQAKEASLS